jgi:glycine betaine catabolism B
MANGFEAIYAGSHERCADVVSFRFAKPPGHVFAPGQWFRLTLGEGAEMTKTFSYSSAPQDSLIEMTTRMSDSAFKLALAALEEGDRVRIAGPGGRLAITDDVPRVTFLTGGTGITPVRSILRDAPARGRVFEDALLLYGNRDELCVPFRNELAQLTDIGVRLVLCYESPSEEWTGERGFITAETVRRHTDAGAGLFVVTGPPAMVGAMERVLDELSVPAERRRIERYGPSE